MKLGVTGNFVSSLYLLKSGFMKKGVRARVILDSGSQRSYITNHLKVELSLPVECQETMLIKTFGSQDENLQTCNAVCFGVKLPDGKDMKMSAYSVPLISEPLTSTSMEFTLPTTQ